MTVCAVLLDNYYYYPTTHTAQLDLLANTKSTW